MNEAYQLAVLESSGRDIASAAKLFAAAFPAATHLDERYLTWQYLENPDGAAVGFNAWLDGVLAAHYVTLPITAVLMGKVTKGLLSLNTATHPAHQGKKLFTQLAEATFKRAKALGYAFVVGVANANSTPGFVKKLGFDLVAPLEARLGVGPIARHRDRGYGYRRQWSDAGLRWRLANPHARYRVVRGGGAARVEGPTGRGGIQVILVELEDSLSLVSPHRLPPLNPVKLWLGLDSNIDWARSRYWPVPQRLRPSPLNFIYRDLTGNTALQLPVRFEAIDFDAY